MKRFIVALLVGTVVFGTVWGLAAALPLNNPVMQSGSDSDLTCDPDGVNLHWGYELDNESILYLKVKDIHTDCDGSRVFVQVRDTSGGVLAQCIDLAIVSNEARCNFSPALNAQAVGQVTVGIQNP